MEFLYFAYECADKSLYFTETLEQCREQAHEYPDKPLPIYAYQFESPDHHDVLNILASMEQPSTALIDACLVERTFIEMVATSSSPAPPNSSQRGIDPDDGDDRDYA